MTYNVDLQHISQRPDLVPQLAEWFQQEWGRLDPTRSMEARRRDLSGRKKTKALPLTMVATVKGEFFGSYSLDLSDLSIRPNLSPWLSCVYVNPKYRKQGLGTLLIRQAMHQAHALRIRALYLFTVQHTKWLTSMGWHLKERIPFRGETITILTFDCKEAGEESEIEMENKAD